MNTPKLPVLLALSGAALSFGTSAVASTVLIYDDFSRGTLDAPVSLTGSAPTIGTGVWEIASGATNHWSTNGSAAVANPAGTTNAYLNFSAETGKIYTLSATMNITSPLAGSGNWWAMGFTTTKVPGFLANTGNSTSGLLYRPTGQYSAWFPTTSSMEGVAGNTITLQPAYADQSGYPYSATLSIVLDTTGEKWTLSYLLNGTSIGDTYTYKVNPTINYIAIGNIANAPGTLDNLTLTSVPEPATTALVLVGGALGICALRRRRKAQAA